MGDVRHGISNEGKWQKDLPPQLKERVIAKLKAKQASPAELSRRYQILIQNLHRWLRVARESE